MSRYIWGLLITLALVVKTSSVRADMPIYSDDEEFKLCTKISDWDTCAREEALRDLNIVKRQYQEILSNPVILQWHPKPEENAEILRDMYDSWTAFRNRLCSLSVKASMYLERLVDERYSCPLYYNKHHEDHLARILELMNKKVPVKRSEFKFLDLTSHDDEYAECVANPKNSTCLDEELKRSAKYIKDLYKTFSEDEFVGKWNNGPDLSRGNYRDMYDSWIAYRNRICSLAVWAYHYAYGKEAITLTQCLQFYNREKLETMENLLYGAHSSLDIGIEEEDSVDGPQQIDPELLNFSIHDDGGEAEGKTITPLQRRIEPTGDRQDDVLEVETKEPVKEPEKSTESEEPEAGHNVPSWAQQ